MLAAARLREVLAGDPSTGVFTWRVRLSNRRLVGAVAGDIKASGYVLIGIDGHRYRAHHLMWLYVYGKWPNQRLDHKNGNRADNRIDNLREATNAQNIRNGRMHRDNASGFKGVTYDPRVQKWEAKIFVDGRSIFLGVFKTPQEAHAAYVVAAERYFGEFARAA